MRISDNQAERLRKWRIHYRSLTEDLAHAGVKDSEIIPLLHSLRQVTFFTHDRGFFARSLLHSAYGLVWLDVLDGEAAEYIRRYLHHSEFRTQKQRCDTVVRVQSGGLRYWRRGDSGLLHASWQ